MQREILSRGTGIRFGCTLRSSPSAAYKLRAFVSMVSTVSNVSYNKANVDLLKSQAERHLELLIRFGDLRGSINLLGVRILHLALTT